ncbi:hypothetical protein CCP4SC76_1210002 [Gammaproteobacteria bacterium]
MMLDLAEVLATFSLLSGEWGIAAERFGRNGRGLQHYRCFWHGAIRDSSTQAFNLVTASLLVDAQANELETRMTEIQIAVTSKLIVRFSST